MRLMGRAVGGRRDGWGERPRQDRRGRRGFRRGIPPHIPPTFPTPHATPTCSVHFQLATCSAHVWWSFPLNPLKSLNPSCPKKSLTNSPVKFLSSPVLFRPAKTPFFFLTIPLISAVLSVSFICSSTCLRRLGFPSSSPRQYCVSKKKFDFLLAFDKTQAF